MKLRFATYDVFTDTRFAGNPLAVVFEADALSDAQMQTIAREFNLSETTFIRRAADDRHTAEVRIFTPQKELPFAGHPTIGSAIAIAEARHKPGAPNDLVLMLEEKVGPVRCAVDIRDGASFAEFSVPKLSEQAGADFSAEAAARALNLKPADIGFGAHAPSIYSAGVKFAMIPVASLDALGRAAPEGMRQDQLIGHGEMFVYARAEPHAAHAFRARMFAPAFGITEDPATGSAVAAFAGVLARFENLGDGWHTLPVLQGVEMGRPSLIGFQVEIKDGLQIGGRIAGAAVKVSEGNIHV